MQHSFGDRQVGPIGYGLSGLTAGQVPPTDEVAFACLKTALERGANYLNGSEFYGTPTANSCHLIKRYLDKYPEDASKVLLNIKGCMLPGLIPDGSAQGTLKSVDNCLFALADKVPIHQFEPARVDPEVPLTTTLDALQECIKAGKIRAMGLSEVSAKTIRNAASAGHQIACVEVELSLFCTDVLENGIASACAELGIPIVAYSPMGKGFLTGAIKSPEDLKDWRKFLPRFQPGNFEKNLELVQKVEVMAASKGCTAAQLAINWVRCLSNQPGMPRIIPIPGASRPERVIENTTLVELTAADMDELKTMLAGFSVSGDRYHAAGQRLTNG